MYFCRSIFKEARFGGQCQIETKNKKTEKVIWEREDCKLCKEHCAAPKFIELLDWKKLSYPHPTQPACVGYCPSNVRTKF